MPARDEVPKPAESPPFHPLPSNSGVAWRWPSWLVPLLIVLPTVMAFLPALRNGFVWDDEPNLVDNLSYRGLGWTQLRWMVTTFHMGHYQPLSWVTFGLDYLLWGLNPVGYHLTNLLLHAANAVVFYFLTLRLLSLALSRLPRGGDLPLRAAAGLAALLFAIHPLRVESVAWASERRDVLSGLFFLLTLLCYLRAATTSADVGTSRRWLIGAVALYALSLLSKAIGMTLPVVLVVLDIYPLRRLGGSPGQWFGPLARRVWWEKVPFLLLALVAGVVAAVAQAQYGAMQSFEEHGVADRVTQALFGLGFYFWKSVLPLGLSPLYVLPVRLDPLDRSFLVSGAVVLAISVGLFLARRRWPAGLAVWVCYVVMLIPVLGTAQSGPQLVADRYTYLSCLGFALLAGAGLLSCLEGWMGGSIGRRTFVSVTGLAAAVLVGFAVLTWKQVQVWHDSERLWRHVLAVDPKSYVAHNNLGFVLFNQDKLDEAIYHYRQALEFNPADTHAQDNLATALVRQGKLDEAIGYYRQVLQVWPAYADAHNNLGNILARQGKFNEAINHYQQALHIQPNFAQAYNNLGAALVLQGRLEEAISHYRQAVQLQPTYAEAHANLGWALGQLGRFEEAIVSYQTALGVAPQDWPQRPFVQSQLNETLGRLQKGKSKRVPVRPAPSRQR